MNKHTPGPWSRSWIYGGIRHLNKNVDEDCFWYPDEGEDRDAANTPNVRNNPADADLIAAAPELLSCALAADEALSNACDPVQDSLNPLEALRWDLRAAIAKATGGGK